MEQDQPPLADAMINATLSSLIEWLAVEKNWTPEAIQKRITWQTLSLLNSRAYPNSQNTLDLELNKKTANKTGPNPSCESLSKRKPETLTENKNFLSTYDISRELSDLDISNVYQLTIGDTIENSLQLIPTFQFSPLQQAFHQYCSHISREKVKQTRCRDEVIVIKLFSFIAGLQDRYMSLSKYKFQTVMGRILGDINHQGNEGPYEEDCLRELRKKTSKNFIKNKDLFYFGNYCGTPDSVLFDIDEIPIAIAEFKSTKEKNEAEAINTVVHPAEIQLAFQMKATNAKAGHIVVYFTTLAKVKIYDYTDNIITNKLVAERERMYQKYRIDLQMLTNSACQKHFPSLVDQLTFVTSKKTSAIDSAQ